eukprot:s521_g7.t1
MTPASPRSTCERNLQGSGPKPAKPAAPPLAPRGVRPPESPSPPAPAREKSMRRSSGKKNEKCTGRLR